MTKAAILQSNYIPWKGYFDIIDSVDFLIIYDEVQYTKNDWRNRNIIITRQGEQWLTIPVSFKFGNSINEAKISDPRFALKHWKTLNTNYARAPYFNETSDWLKPLYQNSSQTSLSKWNVNLLKMICSYLGIKTEFILSNDVETEMGKTTRLVELCDAVGADVYVSGPAAKAYLEIAAFEKKGIKIEWYDYSNYPVYPQLGSTFNHRVSILDLIFNCGSRSTDFMKINR